MRRGRIVVAVVAVVVGLAAVPAPAADGSYRVLLTNDDGIDAEGIEAAASILAADPAYEVTVVAPSTQESGSGTALVIGRDVEVRPHRKVAGCRAWAVAATPATAVRLGVTALMASAPPDLVVSGINRGENVGRSAWYSGTVGAAREGVLAGVPALACSLELDWTDPRPDYAGAARWLKALVDAIRGRGLPADVYLNVNVPRDVAAVHGFRWARMGLAPPETSVFEMVGGEDGARLYRSRWRPPLNGAPGTDIRALAAGWVSVVPLGLDQTDYPALAALGELEPVSPEAPPDTAASGQAAAPAR